MERRGRLRQIIATSILCFALIVTGAACGKESAESALIYSPVVLCPVPTVNQPGRVQAYLFEGNTTTLDLNVYADTPLLGSASTIPGSDGGLIPIDNLVETELDGVKFIAEIVDPKTGDVTGKVEHDLGNCLVLEADREDLQIFIEQMVPDIKPGDRIGMTVDRRNLPLAV